MTAPLRHVFPGEPFEPVAATWNRFIDTTRTVDDARVIFKPGPLLPTPGGGAQIVRFTITSISCPGVAAVGTVTAVMCNGSDASVGDSIDLTDPLGYLVGRTALLIGHTGFAVSMHELDPYSGESCVYEIMSMDDLGYNC